MILPDYSNSVLSTVASVMKAYNLPSVYPTIPALDGMLNPRPKNVVILLLDGMGVTTLEKVLPEDSFLRRHHMHTVTSVFPSTTTAATTAYITGLSPNEHGWLGWSLYFKECGQQIDLFTGCVSHHGNRYGALTPAHVFMPYETLYSRIRRATDDTVATVEISQYPPDVPNGASVNLSCSSHNFAGLASVLEKQIRTHAGEQFIYAYWPNPDSEAHGSGPLSAKSRDVVRALNDEVASLALRLAGTDTLLIVTADHGLRGDMQPAYINRIPEIAECLIMPPSIESRAATFFVKPHKKAQFEKAFAEHFAGDFVLFTRKEVLDMRLFGWGESHPKVDDFLGDYLACAVGDRYIDFAVLHEQERRRFVGAHAGLTDDEMLVPVIALRT